MQLQPSHHADDMGARFGEPSGFNELMSATGVPKYRIVGSMVLCMGKRYPSRTERAIRILRSKQEPLSHAGRVVGHPDTILQKRENRHSKPSSGYAGIPSTIESGTAVGMIRLNFQPDAANNSRNCFSVRSHPPGKISICKSRNLLGEKSLPG